MGFRAPGRQSSKDPWLRSSCAPELQPRLELKETAKSPGHVIEIENIASPKDLVIFQALSWLIVQAA